MKSPVVLLELLKSKYEKANGIGLCYCISRLSNGGSITKEEELWLINYLKSNRPVDALGLFWYRREERAKRYEWLDKHINLNLNPNEMRRFKPRLRNRLGGAFLSVIVLLLLVSTVYQYHMNIVVTIIASLFGLAVWWEISRTLWYYYED